MELGRSCRPNVGRSSRTSTVGTLTRYGPKLLDPGDKVLQRLFRHPGGDWDPPPPAYRNLRVDPPSGHKDDFAVLYTAENLQCIAAERRILAADASGNGTWDKDRALACEVVHYAFTAPACR